MKRRAVAPYGLPSGRTTGRYLAGVSW